MTKDEQNENVWCLLAKSPLRKPEPWFAARTLARARRNPADSTVVSWYAWFLKPGVSWTVAALSLLLAIGVMVWPPLNSIPPAETAASQTAKPSQATEDALHFLADSNRLETEFFIETSL